jgi:hypothetical protein
VRSGELRGYVADLSIGLGHVHFTLVNAPGRCVNGRLEVRELLLKLECHVPVGALKFLPKNHVDAFIRATDSGQHGQPLDLLGFVGRSTLVGDTGHLIQGLSLGPGFSRSLDLLL